MIFHPILSSRSIKLQFLTLTKSDGCLPPTPRFGEEKWIPTRPELVCFFEGSGVQNLGQQTFETRKWDSNSFLDSVRGEQVSTLTVELVGCLLNVLDVFGC